MSIRLEIENLCSALPDTLALLKKAAEAALMQEGISKTVCVHLLLTDDDGIRAYNRDYRGLDKATDVLSFPSLPYTPAQTCSARPEWLEEEYDIDLDACFLGDIVISMPHVKAQAKEYGHSEARETAYLMTHAMFHLMGYDHIQEEDRVQMRKMEEAAIRRFLPTPEEDEMLERARQAMRHSYSPYSGYPVGACVKCSDGTFYTGCNVENAAFGAGICAERTAIFKAVSEGKRSFEAIAIASRTSAPWPCGICRQVMNEFSPDMRVLVTWDGGMDAATLKDLLPHGFGPGELEKHA